MNSKLKRMINEQVSRTINERKRYMKTRALVESMVREELKQYINENAFFESDDNDDDDESNTKVSKNKGSIHQFQTALRDDAVNMTGLIDKIPGMPSNPDSARSIISKWSRGVIDPSPEQANAGLHVLAASN